jgi:hypothetical protein
MKGGGPTWGSAGPFSLEQDFRTLSDTRFANTCAKTKIGERGPVRFMLSPAFYMRFRAITNSSISGSNPVGRHSCGANRLLYQINRGSGRFLISVEVQFSAVLAEKLLPLLPV